MIQCSIDKLSWNLYRHVKKQKEEKEDDNEDEKKKKKNDRESEKNLSQFKQ